MGRVDDRTGLERHGATDPATRWRPKCCAPGRRLPEIGQVLRHYSQPSAPFYAKVDHNAPRPWHPWPGAGKLGTRATREWTPAIVCA